MSTSEERERMLAQLVERLTIWNQQRQWQPAHHWIAQSPQDRWSSDSAGRDWKTTVQPVVERSAAAGGEVRLRAAASWSQVALPGPIGELISREITAHLTVGHLFDGSGFMAGLAEQVLAIGLPPDTECEDHSLTRRGVPHD